MTDWGVFCSRFTKIGVLIRIASHTPAGNTSTDGGGRKVMRGRSGTFSGSPGALLIALVVCCGIASTGYCRGDAVHLFVQQSPWRGGTVIPGEGMHAFTPNAQVTVSAVAKPGYEFSCWLGDVANPTSQETRVLLNEPKIVVAVFRRVEENLLIKAGSRGGGGGAGGTSLFAVPPSVWSGGQASASAPGSRRPSFDAEAAPVPEPATLAILGAGSLFLLRPRRPRRQ